MNLGDFKASTAIEKLKHDAQSQDANDMQATPVLYDTFRGCISTEVQSMGGRMGLWTFSTRCFHWGYCHATSSTLETKAICYLSSLALCEALFLTSNFGSIHAITMSPQCEYRFLSHLRSTCEVIKIAASPHIKNWALLLRVLRARPRACGDEWFPLHLQGDHFTLEELFIEIPYSLLKSSFSKEEIFYSLLN